MLERNLRPSLFSRVISSLGSLVSKIPLNDPTTPALCMDLPMPSMGSLKYSVRDFSANPRNSQESRALNCHVTLGNCINAVQSMMVRPLAKWSFVNVLQIVPAAGADMNAYYDRRSLKFFYHNHRGKTVYFGDSADIIAHELGHAILDAMRPDFWSVQALEVWSFHEAFSDIVAVFNILKYELAVRYILEETNGDLRLPNHCSRLAEEVGGLIRDYTGDPAYMRDALRDPARERFHYVNPRSLPPNAKNNFLAAECHSFGRVFSAAWYEAFVRVYEHLVAAGSRPEDALVKSRDICFDVLLKGASASPRVVEYYEAVARCMVSVASNHGPEISYIFSDVFKEWNIIRSDRARVMSSSRRKITGGLKKEDSVVKTKTGSIITVRNNSLMNYVELPMIGGLSVPNDISIEVPKDSYYETDPKGNVIFEIVPDKDLIVEDATRCMLQVHNELDSGGMWEFKKGRVSRRLIR